MSRSPRRAGRIFVPVAAALAVFASACDDDLFQQNWDSIEDTVSLFSLARPELNLPSAISFDNRAFVEIEQSTASGTWDIALDTENGQLVFVTPRLLGIESEAGITKVDAASFESLSRAPGDTVLYYNTEPVIVELNGIYVVRTYESQGTFGQNCNNYAKLQPLAMDPILGTVEFRFDSNPVCNDRDLIPPN